MRTAIFTVLFIAPLFVLPWRPDARLDDSQESIRRLLKSNSPYAERSLITVLSSVDPNLVLDGRPLLFHMIERCNRSELEVLLDRHADPNATNAGGEHALIAAMRRSDYDCEPDGLAEALIAHGAKVNVREGDDTPLSLAMGAPWPNYTLAKTMIRAGADPNEPIKNRYTTGVPLDVPLQFEDLNQARMLIESGAHLSEAESHLLNAIEHGHLGFAQQLIDIGITLLPSHAEHAFHTLLRPSAEANLSYHGSQATQEQAIAFLLKLNPPLDVVLDGEPLLAYAQQHAPHTLKLLLDAGASPNYKDARGLSPLWRITLARNRTECPVEELRLFLDHGADANATVPYSRVYTESEERLQRGHFSDEHDPRRQVSLLEAAIVIQGAYPQGHKCVELVAERQAKVDRYTEESLYYFDSNLRSKLSSKIYGY
jgi:ankyrin repeat protein